MIRISEPAIEDQELDRVVAVLRSGNLAQGKEVLKLEEGFKSLCRTEHSIAVSSGTSALHVTLMAHKIGPGDEVITTPFSFIATANSILFVGAKPVFVDIEEDTFNINPDKIEKAITEKTKAILIVHLYGLPCNMEKIQKICKKHRLALIEDACQAVGASFGGQPVGSFGTGCFSLYATKNICAGEGGMITTSDPNVREQCLLLRSHGSVIRYEYRQIGFNFRMNDLNAAVGVAQFEKLEQFNKRRRINAEMLQGLLRGVDVPVCPPGFVHAWHQFTVKFKRKSLERTSRPEIIERLKARGMESAVFYPHPLHQVPHIKAVAGESQCPVAEDVSSRVLSLPIHPRVGDEDIRQVAEIFNQVIEGV